MNAPQRIDTNRYYRMAKLQIDKKSTRADMNDKEKKEGNN